MSFPNTCRKSRNVEANKNGLNIVNLNCLVLFELKVDRFEPEYLGKLSFYLETLDWDKKPHENPAIRILLCASKDDEFVEYALNRTLSPALIAEYRAQLSDRKLLKEKLHEFYLQNNEQE